MPTLYDSNNRENWVYQPNLVRNNSRYRGVRESLKINQEVQQIYFDLNRLDVLYKSFEDHVVDKVDTLRNGIDQLEDLEFNWEDDEVSDQVLALDGLSNFQMFVEDVRHRLRVLEL